MRLPQPPLNALWARSPVVLDAGWTWASPENIYRRPVSWLYPIPGKSELPTSGCSASVFSEASQWIRHAAKMENGWCGTCSACGQNQPCTKALQLYPANWRVRSHLRYWNLFQELHFLSLELKNNHPLCFRDSRSLGRSKNFGFGLFRCCSDCHPCWGKTSCLLASVCGYLFYCTYNIIPCTGWCKEAGGDDVGILHVLYLGLGAGVETWHLPTSSFSVPSTPYAWFKINQ